MRTFFKYFFFIYILAISTFEYFHRITQEANYLLFVISFIFLFLSKDKINKKAYLIVLPFAFTFLLQSFYYQIPYYFFITLIIRLLGIYFALKFIGEDFVKVFVNLIKTISLISLFFYAMQYIPAVYNAMLSFSKLFVNLASDPSIVVDRPNFIIYCIQQNKGADYGSFFRNSGPFWEPGLYAVFLNLALFVNLLKYKNIFSKVNVLFIISIISTLSTTGLIVFFLIVLYYVLLIAKTNPILKFGIIGFFVLFIPTISSLPFMKDKIVDQFAQSDVSYSRFGAAVVHYNIVKDYPISGFPFSEKAYAKYANSISPNGVTEIFVRYGVIAGFLYYIFLYNACKSIMFSIGYPRKGFFLFFITLVLLFSQTIGNRPIFLMLLFIPVINLKQGFKLVNKQ